MNVRLLLEYDGSSFCGWQFQPSQRSVQGVLQSALLRVTGEITAVHGSGRTDAGVHALGQVASFVTEAGIPPDRFKPAINRLLPPDVRVLSSAQVPDDFHARYSALSKTYMYKVVQADVTPPLMRDRAWAVRQSLDLEAMRAALATLLGTHDFRAFCRGGSSVTRTVRTITQAELRVEPDQGTIELWVSADGFLYNMVRIIAATAIRVGMGKLPVDVFVSAIATGLRSLLPYTAPPQGLYLASVRYEPEASK